jgi:aminotransferase EvaB
MKVPLNDLSREIADISSQLQERIARVMNRGWFLMGSELTDFEHAFAKYLGCTYFVGLANGTDALEIALRCMGVGSEDKVIVAPNAAMYGTLGVLNCGAEPVFSDVDPVTLCMSPESFASLAAKGDYKAVIVTHLYGQMAEIESICKIAHDHGIKVIEDCAQAHGARRHGRMAGTVGDIATFSFYPTKNLGALGDGGGLVSNDPEVLEKARSLRQYGWKTKKYFVDTPYGRNSRLDEIQAACLSVKLAKLDMRNARRRVIWSRYKVALNGQLPLVGSNDESFIAHLCVIRSIDRDNLRARLSESGVATDVHYPVPDYRQTIFGSRFAEIHRPVAEAACREVLTVPCFPEMTDAEVDYVADALIKLL